MQRRTKIVATLGPSSRDLPAGGSLVAAGADIVRLNFAHSTPDVHAAAAAEARRQARELGRVVGVLVDLPGPKMRTGPVEGDGVHLEPGAVLTLTTRDIVGDASHVSVTVPDLPALVDRDDEIHLADGQIVLSVRAVADGEVRAEVTRGGILRSRKGLHLPHAERRLRAFTPQDEQALEVALTIKADLVGLSFVRDADDIRRAKSALPRRGTRPLIVAKIETAMALDCLQEIASEADALMVARGDLGIQMPLERVPFLQKEIIRTCNEAGIPVITATQMLESMTSARLPTRAEVTDVANAVLDGSDALMLSEETAVGEHPTESIRVMASIIETAESATREHREPTGLTDRDDPVSWAVARAAVQAAHDLRVAAIVCPTQSGATARKVAAFRPNMPVYALSDREAVLGALALTWGTIPLRAPAAGTSGDAGAVVAKAVEVVVAAGQVFSGDLVAVVAGSSGPRAGTTDFLRIVRA